MWMVQGGPRQRSRQSRDQSASCQPSSARQDHAGYWNQIRGLLKSRARHRTSKENTFAARAAELAEDRPELAAAVDPLLKAREAMGQQILDLDRKVLRLARNNAQVRRFMTAPGVGPVTALCFLATIDAPARFKRSRSVGAYVGLTTHRSASGEIDWTGKSRNAAIRCCEVTSTRQPMCCPPV